MYLTFKLITYIHILAGSAALVLFWISMTSSKGGLDHNKYGQYYGSTMYILAVTGFVMSLMSLLAPMTTHYAIPANKPTVATRIQELSWFLMFISWLTFTSIKQGLCVLKYKHSPEKLSHVSHFVFPLVLLVASVFMFAWGLSNHNVLHIAFGILGLITGFNMVKYCLVKQSTSNHWILEHISSMIGSGIAAYTAFFTFGARTFLSDIGYWQLAFWVLPGVIGGFVIAHYSKRYKLST